MPWRTAGWAHALRRPAAPARRPRPRPRGGDGVLGLAGPARHRLGGRHPRGPHGSRGRRAEGDEAVERALADVELARWRRTLPATVVAREGWTPWVPRARGGGHRHPARGRARGGRRARGAPGRPLGRPTARSTGAGSGRRPSSCRATCRPGGTGSSPTSTRPRSTRTRREATLVVTPQRLELPPAVAEGRVVGLMAQLYQVRSAESWGVGDLGDLADLATWAAAAHDADFVLINPLHAAEPVAPVEPSPYLPTTRRFVNPIYLRVEDVPELGAARPRGVPARADARGDRAGARRRGPDRPRRRLDGEEGGPAPRLRGAA